MSIAMYSVYLLVGAFSVNPWMLIMSRFMAGIGIGREFPISNSYLRDISPAR
jgi:putative MFS transporter